MAKHEMMESGGMMGGMMKGGGMMGGMMEGGEAPSAGEPPATPDHEKHHPQQGTE
jgi:hypothetical protein